MNLNATDMELRAHADHHASLRLWLRLLSATTRIEDTIRQRLREQFDITLPRFDLMAQLEREPQGLSMSELSRRMMVTGGNVTSIVDQLEKEQLVQRQMQASDRRSYTVSLTEAGRKAFAAMALAHEGWVVELLSPLAEREQTQLHQLLGTLKSGNQPMADSQPEHFLLSVKDGVATVSLNRPERKNPLSFDSYAELRDFFRALPYAPDIHAVVITGAGGNFCSGGDVHEIIGPLTKLDMPGLLAFTRMTGDLVKAMRACPQPIIAAIDGVCAGAGAILAMASDLRYGTERSKTYFLFNKVGLAGCDMGACALLPRIIGQGRASELLFTGRGLGALEAERWGFYNRVCEADSVLADAQAIAVQLVAGPTFANGITKKMLQQEWNMGVDEAIEAEAQAQAICMATNDFHRAYHAFVAKQTPVFEGD